MSDEKMAYRCGVRRMSQCPSRDIRPILARSRLNGRRIGLDEVFKYLSRHSIGQMTSYGKCCGRTIVAKNWKYCPFDGAPLLDGQPVTLRSRIQDAEQTGMTDYLDRLDAPANPSRPTMAWTMKKLRLLATSIQLVGRSKLSKPELVEAIRAHQGNEPLLDF